MKLSTLSHADTVVQNLENGRTKDTMCGNYFDLLMIFAPLHERQLYVVLATYIQRQAAADTPWLVKVCLFCVCGILLHSFIVGKAIPVSTMPVVSTNTAAPGRKVSLCLI